MERKEFESIAPGLRENIVRMVRRILPPDKSPEVADDVAQDTLLILWDRRESIDTYRSIEALAMVIARNRTIDLLRRDHSGATVSLDDVADPCDISPGPHERVLAGEAARRLQSIMESLPTAQQALIRMRHVEMMEIDRIAAITGSTPGAIRVMLSRARNHVKNLFLKNDEQ